ncbi:MAG TPA: type III-A CRISPR-associated RAMP protein Csm5, partial [Candidatus Aminicenantes bacterium]|nr:type III-A CRISPR-associated RAMP protein Csm5 [Candidatus Aminicenantes bacterium]
MQNQQLNHYRVNLHILSPIHVGTGQDLDPFSYVIRNKGLFIIDLVKWIESFPEKDKLESMMNSDNFANIRSFIAERFDLENAVLCSIPVDNPNLLKTYKKAIKEKDPRNQVLISPVMRNEVTMAAYIPGSSVKGAMRTAIANRFVEPARVTSQDRYDYNFKIFGKINEDPMRNLKISDVSLGKSNTAIVEAKEYPLNPDKPLTPKGHMEVALSLSHVGKPFVFPLKLSMAPFRLHGAKVDPNFLLDSLYRFYATKYEEENLKFFQPQDSHEVQKGIISMNKVVANLRTNETLIRIGHFSHVECITLDKVRSPKTRKARGQFLPWGTTRTLANGIYPFGWAKLEFLDLVSNPRPKKDWSFPVVDEEKDTAKFVPETPGFNAPYETGADVERKKDKPVAKKSVSPLEKLIRELDIVKPNDMGRIGTIIQKIDALETDAEKTSIAEAIRNKIGPKAFKKHKRKEYLLEL